MRHGRANGVAVAAEHALLFDHLDRCLPVHGRRPDGAGGAGGDQRGHFADLRQDVVPDLRRLAVNAENGDVGAMHGAAHVQAAGHARCAVWPAASLRRSSGYSASITHFTMPEASVADEWQCTQPCVWTMLLMLLLVPPTGKPAAASSCLQRLDVGRIVEQKFDVVAAGEAQIAAAVFVGQIGEQADGLDAQQARRSRPARCRASRPIRRRGRARPGASGLVVLPLPVVPLDDRRQELLVMRRADIGDSFRLSSVVVMCSPPRYFASSLVWKKM